MAYDAASQALGCPSQAPPRYHASNRLRPTPRAHWLKVRLTGVASNRSAIGARIRVEFEEDGERRSVHRRVNSGGSFGCNSFTQHLGVGQATEVDVLEVFWPRTGKTQAFRDIAVDQRVEILEGAEAAVFFEETPFRLGG